MVSKMRWFLFFCILQISLIITSATEDDRPRRKRDFAFMKDLFQAAIFGSDKSTPITPVAIPNNRENYKIFRIPGFKKILVKAVPKGAVAGGTVVPVPNNVGVIAQNPTLALVNSYLGTKTSIETLKALEGMNNLFKSGILTAPRDAMTNIYAPVPNIIEISHSVPIPTSPTKYSYKQIHGDKTFTSYTANDDRNVIVTKSDKPLPLPPFMRYRLGEVIKLGAQMVNIGMPVPVMPVIRRPVVEYLDYPKINPYMSVTPQMFGINNNYSYKQIHNDGTMSDYSSSDLKGSNIQVLAGVGRRPAIPAFITDRIEKIAVSTASSKLPNPIILGGLTVIPTYSYSTMVSGYPVFDTKGQAKVQINTNLNETEFKNVNPASQFSYQTVHKDGSVTTHAESAPEENIKIGQTLASPYLYNQLFSRYPSIDINEKVHAGVNIHRNNYQVASPTTFPYQAIHKEGSVNSFNESSMDSKIKVSSGQILSPTFSPLINRYPMFDTKGEVKVTTNFNKNQKIFTNVSPYGILPYETIVKPLYPMPLSPAFISHRIADIAKVNGDSFSYRIVHSNGAVTNYGVPVAMNENKNDHKQLHINCEPNATFSYKTVQDVAKIPMRSVSPVLGTSTVTKVNGDSFSYRVEHNDGTITKYDTAGSHTGRNNNNHSSTDARLDENRDISINLKEDSVNKVSNYENLLTRNKGSSGFSYNTVHKDGSVTSYQGDMQTSHLGSNIATDNVNNKPLSMTGKNNDFVQNKEHLYISGVNNNHTPDGPVVHQNEFPTATTNNEKNNTNYNNKLSSGFSYKLVNSVLALKNHKQGNDLSSPVTSTYKGIEATSTTPSGYSYKLIHNALFTNENVEPTRRLVTPATVTGDKAIIDNTQSAIRNMNMKVDTSYNENAYIPPTPGNVPSFINHDKNSQNNAYANMASTSENVPILIKPLNNGQSTTDFSNESSLSTNPIVVLDEPLTHSYQQSSSDSSVNVKSNQNTLRPQASTRRAPPRRRPPLKKISRGDIPDTSY